MNSLMPKLCTLIGLGCIQWSSSAWAALACSITASPSLIQGIYASGANLDVQGSFTGTCTRNPATDPRKRDIWIGIDQSIAGRTMTRDVGGSTLTYFVYRQAPGTSVWTSIGSRKANAAGDTGLLESLDFGSTGAVLSLNIPFYWRVPAGQTRPAGIYLESGVAVTVRDGSDTGTYINSTLLNSRVSIQHDCRFSTAPLPMSLSYTAFASAAVSASTSFAVTCTQGTSYTLSLDSTRSVIPTVELLYSLSLSGLSGTGSAVGQSFSVDVTIDPGQAGRCSAGTCSGTDVRTITVTY